MTEPLNLQQQKELSLNSSSEVLAAHIVAYKVLGLNKEFAVFCMQELANRRGKGDTFDFESYIELNVQKMPKPVPMDLKKMSGLMNLKGMASLTDLIKK